MKLLEKNLYLTAIMILLLGISNAQTPPEFRGVWVASVANLDWPPSNEISPEEQKSTLKRMMEKLAELNFNAVILQIRPESDALYESSVEPWSYWLTGTQGKAPEPFYDPLKYAVKTAHQFGLELHVWINPYRVLRKKDSYELAANNVAILHPGWVITIGDYLFLNPALEETRNYVARIVEDILKRYDIDGVHLDDYFYPYIPNEITNEDSLMFANNPRGFVNIEDWRRDNVNLLLKKIYRTIKKIKPFVRFGVSPFGIYKNNVPEGITGYSAYDKIYCDPIAWIEDKTVDYLSPQLYWEIGGAQDFKKLSLWWNDAAEGIDIFPGLAVYKIKTKNWNESEIPNQVEFARTLSNTKGAIYFRAGMVLENIGNITDSLKVLYSSKALPPSFYSEAIPSAPEYAYYKFINDTLIEIHNLSNYSGKYGIYSAEGELLAVNYSSIAKFNASNINLLKLKNISRFDAVNGKSVVFKLEKNEKELKLLFPYDGATIEGNAFVPKLSGNDAFRFAISELSDDVNFYSNLVIRFHNYDVGEPVQVLKKRGIRFFKYSVVDKNGKIIEFPPVKIIVNP